jgi:hypothetical protein
MRKTVPILLPKDDDLLATMRLFCRIANEASLIAFEHKGNLKGS